MIGDKSDTTSGIGASRGMFVARHLTAGFNALIECVFPNNALPGSTEQSCKNMKIVLKKFFSEE